MIERVRAVIGALAAGLASFSTAFAGAWDVGAFDNDDALDYVYELQEYDTYKVLWMPLGKACLAADYIDAMVGAQAIASAEVIAAILGNPVENLPDEVQAIAAAYDGEPDTKLVGSAKACVSRVLDTDVSELAQLWQEVGDYDVWRESTTDLLRRLQRE